MYVYIAHNFEAREKLRELVKPLEAAGHHVCSRWLYMQLETPEANAQMDVEDISKADIVIVCIDNYGDRPGRGKYVEWGYALSMLRERKLVALILAGNDKNCVFYHHPDMRIWRYATIEQAIEQTIREW